MGFSHHIMGECPTWCSMLSHNLPHHSIWCNNCWQHVIDTVIIMLYSYNSKKYICVLFYIDFNSNMLDSSRKIKILLPLYFISQCWEGTCCWKPYLWLSHIMPPGPIRAVPGLFLTKIVRSLTWFVWDPCSTVQILPPCFNACIISLQAPYRFRNRKQP